jgi:hypothetical protein
MSSIDRFACIGLFAIFGAAVVSCGNDNENSSIGGSGGATTGATNSQTIVAVGGHPTTAVNVSSAGTDIGSVHSNAGGTTGSKTTAANAAAAGKGSGVGGAAGKKTTGSAGAAGSKKTGAAGKAGAGTPSDTCDRKCLLGYISDYLDALVAKDPSRLKVSAEVKFTINDEVKKLGDGVWATASSIDKEKRLDFADPVWSNVATQVVVYENGSTPVIYQARLKVVKRQITEIETMEVRQADAANGFFMVDNMKPQPVFFETIEPSKRMNREKLQEIMELYMDYLEGKKSGAELPFDTNCTRYENGVPTASGVAAFQGQSWFFQVTRRYLIFDEEAGIAWGMFPFFPNAGMLVVGEAFKIIDGKFMMIQAVMQYMYNPDTWK